ncbi:hypothetical protein CRUP_024010 [Coryphaenoides rupestris]|nr:hypothetical protein CRUP_024010 [Coryphaenoides rupestris]
MSADDFVGILKGKRVKLTLRSASYFGVVERLNSDRTLTLTDVVDVKDGRRFPGTKLFFGRDILNDNNDGDDSDYVSFEVVDELNEKFGPAIATKNRVYLFDILLLGARAFKNGLFMILQSTCILKVVHDCRGLASALMAQFGVSLTNVFDTQVADVMCFHSDTGGFLPDRVSTLQEVVTLYLKVPSSRLSSLRMKSQLTKEEREMWYVRPCPMSLLKVMALGVIHLQSLRLVLLDTLMRDYMALVDSYLSGSLWEPGEVEHITMSSVLELPRELRGLEQERCERQRVAVQSYKVTQQGLLDRYNPLTETPPKATPPPTALPVTTQLSQTPPKATIPPTALPVTAHLSQTPPKATIPPTTLPVTTHLSQTPPKATIPPTTLPVTTHLSQTPPKATIPPTALPVTTHLSQTPPKATIPPTTLPVTAHLSQTTPKATLPPTTLPMTTHLSQTPPKATPPPTTLPMTTHLSQTPPKTMPLTLPMTTHLSQSPLKATPLPQTPPITTDRMGPRIAAHHVSHHTQPPPSAPALVPLHIQIPTSSPQVTKVPSLQSTAPAPSPAPTVLSLAPPPAAAAAAAPRASSSPSGPGMKGLMLDMFGRGRPLSEAPQAATLPSRGRGFLQLQIAPAVSQVPKDGFTPRAPEDSRMCPGAVPGLAGDTAAPRDPSDAGVWRGYIPALGRGQLNPCSSALSQSFVSFRKM